MNIIPVKHKRQLKEFLNIPYVLHKENKNFISSLDINTESILNEAKNPLWQIASKELYIIYDEHGVACGRIVAIFHPEYFRNTQKGFFGYFDCINNSHVAGILLETASQYLQSFQCKEMIGPFNPSLNYELGVLTDGFEIPPYFMMNYNHPYYTTLLLEKCQELMQFYAYKIAEGFDDVKIERIKNAISTKTQAYITDLNYNDYNNSAIELCDIYNNAFEGHFGFVPFSHEEFIFLAKNLKQILHKKLLFKVCIGSEAVGFILAIPNLNEIIHSFPDGKINLWRLIQLLTKKKKIKSTKIMIAAIKKPYQHLGLGSLLYCEMRTRCKELGFIQGEISWIAADNIKMNKIVQSLGATIHKTYAIYSYPIQ